MANSTFSSAASELLSLLPALSVFFGGLLGKLEGDLLAAVVSLVACMHVVDLLMALKVPDAVAVVDLRAAIQDHAEKRQAGFGADLDDAAIKAHLAGAHLANQCEKHGTLFSCFVQERHHRLLTKYAAQRKSTRTYEVGVVEEITVEQVQDLEKDITHFVRCGLREFVAGWRTCSCCGHLAQSIKRLRSQ